MHLNYISTRKSLAKTRPKTNWTSSSVGWDHLLLRIFGRWLFAALVRFSSDTISYLYSMMISNQTVETIKIILLFSTLFAKGPVS